MRRMISRLIVCCSLIWLFNLSKRFFSCPEKHEAIDERSVLMSRTNTLNTKKIERML
jgi:hypothetical protein